MRKQGNIKNSQYLHTEEQMDVSVVAPVYNEVENLEMLCRRIDEVLAKTGETYEIVLVDDGSTDGSWEKMLELSAVIKHLRLIRFRRNFGQTAAMSAGFRESKGEIIITMDADLQNDPEDIPALLKKIREGCDVVSGWRKDRQDAFVNRKLPSMLANRLIGRITGIRLHDFGCTLKAYRRDIMEKVHLYGEMHRFIPALASWVGGEVREIPVKHHPRRFGKSKYGLSRTVRVILDLVTVSFLLRYSTRPIQIFGKIGIALGVPGFLMIALMVMTHISFLLFGTEFWADLIKRPFWIMTAFMLIFFGIQLVSMGLLAEIQIRTWHEAQNKPIYVIREIVEPRIV